MDKIAIPEGYQMIMPYLIVRNALGLSQFLRDVFGMQEKMLHKMDDGSVMHGEMTHGGSTIMFGEASAQWPANPAGIFIYVSDVDAAHKKALALGAVTVEEPQDKAYGRASGVRDPFGNTWWITAPL